MIVNIASLEFGLRWPKGWSFHHLRVLTQTRKPVSGVYISDQTHGTLLPPSRNRLLYITTFKKLFLRILNKNNIVNYNLIYENKTKSRKKEFFNVFLGLG